MTIAASPYGVVKHTGYGLELVNLSQELVSQVDFFFSSRRRHTRFDCDWSSDVCSSDWTRIVLSADSKLRVPADYGVTARAVYLAGEAYFAIAHDAAKPFAVHAGPGVIWDLGTRFGVRAYADEPEVEVVVADGKVRVRAAGNPDSAGQVVNGGGGSPPRPTGVGGPPRRVGTRRHP